MSPRQTALYWREWGAVRKAKADADRHAFHVEALGYDKSMKDLTNEEFDKVLSQFRIVSDPGNLQVQLRQLSQPKKRLLWKIRRLADKPYIDAILRDRFNNQLLEDLQEEELTQMRNTLDARARAQRRKGKREELTIENEPAELPGEPVCPF